MRELKTREELARNYEEMFPACAGIERRGPEERPVQPECFPRVRELKKDVLDEIVLSAMFPACAGIETRGCRASKTCRNVSRVCGN